MRSVAAPGLGVTMLVALAVVATTPRAAAQRAGRGAATPAPARPSQPPRPAARADAAVPFKVGETLTYDVSWSSMITAGTATTTVVAKKPSGSSTAYEFVAEGRPVRLLAALYPLYYKMTSLLDTYTLLSERGSLYAEERTEKRTSVTVFDRAKRKVHFEQTTDTTAAFDYDVPAQVEDGLAAFYVLRARGVKAGERFTIPVADSGSIFTVQFTVGALEQIKVPLGTLPAWNINIALTDINGALFWTDTVVWMSNDARRLPLKLQARLPVGHFVLTLKDVR